MDKNESKRFRYFNNEPMSATSFEIALSGIEIYRSNELNGVKMGSCDHTKVLFVIM